MIMRTGNFMGALRTLLRVVRVQLWVAAVVLLLILAMIAGSYAADLMMPSGDPARPTLITEDDNGDGVITEDESGWDCATMGNRMCGTAFA